jgi:hypothetical protein
MKRITLLFVSVLMMFLNTSAKITTTPIPLTGIPFTGEYPWQIVLEGTGTPHFVFNNANVTTSDYKSAKIDYQVISGDLKLYVRSDDVTPKPQQLIGEFRTGDKGEETVEFDKTVFTSTTGTNYKFYLIIEGAGTILLNKVAFIASDNTEHYLNYKATYGTKSYNCYSAVATLAKNSAIGGASWMPSTATKDASNNNTLTANLVEGEFHDYTINLNKAATDPTNWQFRYTYKTGKSTRYNFADSHIKITDTQITMSLTSSYIKGVDIFCTNASSLDIASVTRTVYTPITVSTTAPISLNGTESYWSTFYADGNCIIPEGVTAYYVSSVANGHAYLTKISGTILPSKHGYLLSTSTKQDALSFAYTKEAATDEISNDYLYGGEDETTDNTTGYKYYILGKKTDGSATSYGFYFQNGTSGASVTSAANKAYLKVPSTGNANGFTLTIGDETTGIHSAAVNAKGDNWYTLQGVRMNSKPTQRGMYILNNNKVIIK